MALLVHRVACERCGASLDIPSAKRFIVCPHCRNVQHLPLEMGGDSSEEPWEDFAQYFDSSSYAELTDLAKRIDEISRRDPQVHLARDATEAAFNKALQSADPVVDCKILFSCAKDYSELLKAHPRYPDAMHISAVGNARLIVRSTVDRAAIYWGTDISEQVLRLVVGDRPSQECLVCGAPIQGQATLIQQNRACTFCHSFIDLLREDPFVLAVRKSVEATPASERLAVLLDLLLVPYRGGTGTVRVSSAVDLVRRFEPNLPSGKFRHAAENALGGMTGEPRNFMRNVGLSLYPNERDLFAAPRRQEQRDHEPSIATPKKKSAVVQVLTFYGFASSCLAGFIAYGVARQDSSFLPDALSALFSFKQGDSERVHDDAMQSAEALQVEAARTLKEAEVRTAEVRARGAEARARAEEIRTRAMEARAAAHHVRPQNTHASIRVATIPENAILQWDGRIQRKRRFRVSRDEQPHQLVVTAPGYAMRTLEVMADSDRDLRVALEPLQ